MTARNMGELDAMLLRELERAMGEASVQMFEDAQTETAKFYTKGEPKQYKRTGTLGRSPRKTEVSTSGKKVSYDVYLATDEEGYTTGTFSKLDVLTAAESTSNRAGILGKPQFWANSKKKFGKTLDRTMKKHFK